MSERLVLPFHGDGKAWNFGRKPGTWRDEISGGDVSAARIARGDVGLRPSAGDLTGRSAASGEPRTAVPRVRRPAPRRV